MSQTLIVKFSSNGNQEQISGFFAALDSSISAAMAEVPPTFPSGSYSRSNNVVEIIVGTLASQDETSAIQAINSHTRAAYTSSLLNGGLYNIGIKIEKYITMTPENMAPAELIDRASKIFPTDSLYCVKSNELISASSDTLVPMTGTSPPFTLSIPIPGTYLVNVVIECRGSSGKEATIALFSGETQIESTTFKGSNSSIFSNQFATITVTTSGTVFTTRWSIESQSIDSRYRYLTALRL